MSLNDNAGKTALLKLNETMSEPLEQLVLYIEALVSRLGLEDIAEMTRRIKAAKQRLKDLVSAYKKKPSPGLKSRILRNIKRLKERMRGLRERMARVSKLPDEFLNIDGLKNGKDWRKPSEYRSAARDSLEDGPGPLGRNPRGLGRDGLRSNSYRMRWMKIYVP